LVTNPSAETNADDHDGVDIHDGSDVEELLCSAKGCRKPGAYALSWNNPKVHTPDRRKTWLACDEHRESLSTFLDVRGFLRDVTPL
jgi:hypothetical protein